MTRHKARLSFKTAKGNPSYVHLAGLPSEVLGALKVLTTFPGHPGLRTDRQPDALLIFADSPSSEPRHFAHERIAWQFEHWAEHLQTWCDLILLHQLRAADGESLPLHFDLATLDIDIGTALRRLRWRKPLLRQAARELQTQLALVFNIRTLAQLVLKLSIILDESLQLVCADFQRALIAAFWGWADANRLYVLYCLLERNAVVLSDTAFFLVYTKWLDRMTATRIPGVNDIGVDGRLQLPLSDDPLPLLVPPVWRRAMTQRFERIRADLSARVVTMETDPPIWTTAF